VVENTPTFPAAWITIDFENEAVTAIQVSLSTVPGLAATNVQTGIQELEIKAEKSITDLNAPGADSLSVTISPQSFTGRTASIRLGPATQVDLGGVFVQGPSTGILLGGDGSLSLAIASTTQLGGVKVGRNLTIDPDGTLNAEGGGSIFARDIVVDPLIPGITSANTVQLALEALELQVQDRVEFCTIAGAGGMVAQISPPVTTSNDGTRLTLSTLRANVGTVGVTQLTSDVTGNSEDLALTQFAASQLNAKIAALTGANVLAGTYNSRTGVVASVTPAGSAYLTVGAQAPVASGLPDNYYLLVVNAGVIGPPGAVIPPTGVQSGDWFVVEKEQGSQAAWVTIDFENTAIAAVNVSLSPVAGLAATNVQAGIAELEVKAENSFTNITATAADGISVTNTGPSPGGRTCNITLGPATSTDLGGVFVQPNVGLILGSNGALSLDIASPTKLGGIKVGQNLTIEPDGTLNASGGGGGGVDVKLVNLDAPFDGSKTAFQMLSGGAPFAPKASHYVMIVVGGIVQSANDAYTTTGDTINFSEAPPAGATFYSIGFG
jgi:hypothetical protein